MSELFETAGKVAGLAGLCVVLVLLVFREVIQKALLSKLSPKDAYRFFRLLILSTSVVAVIGMILWVTPTIVVGDSNLIMKGR
jgi:hypothetical protein